MSGTTISTSDTKIEALKFQSSSYGGAIPVVYGVTRIPANLLWYGGFKATAKTTVSSAGGKGGDVTTSNTTYTYSAAVAIGLCEGQITGIGSIWRGKNQYSGGPSASQIITASDAYLVPGGGGSRTVPVSTGTFSANISVTSPSGGGEISQDPMTLAEGTDYTRVGGVYTFAGNWAGTTLTISYQYLTASVVQTSLQQLGLSLASGALGQAVWSYLTTNYPAQAIGYSGTAFAYGSAYNLGDNATVQNHSFEVQAKMAYTISTTVPDADPALAMYDLLTSAQYGANFPATRIYSVTNWSNYCRAAGLLLSPALTEQMSAADAVVQMCKLTNTGPVWSEGVLKFIPYGDTALTANGATYTPNTTAIYDLDDRHFLDLDVPVKLTRKAPADAFNQIQVEFWNRSNQYNTDIAESKDQANIDTYGARPAAVFEAHWCADPVVARNIAQIALQRALYVRNTYQFKLSKLFSLLEPMDIVTLTDSALALSLLPVRITNVEEGDDEFTLTAEDFTIGVATTTLYPSQSGAGFSHNYNASPGSVNAPLLFEMPGALTTNGLELGVAAMGAGANWGGAHVWVSLDGSNYKNVGTLSGPSRFGTLTAAPGSSGTISIAIGTGTITSGSAADAAALNTLCMIGGANPEFFAYQTATLTSALHYDFTVNVRGVYGTAAVAHSSGDSFVRIDQAVVRSGTIDLGYVGKTIHVKLTSFNVYGGAEESLASATDYTYTLTGAQIKNNAGAAGATTTLVPSAGVSLVGRRAVKVSAASAWDQQVYSAESFTGGAFASATASTNAMFGLNTDPVTDADYLSIDYTMHCSSSGNLYAYENGTATLIGTWVAGDALWVGYDNANVRYLKNGVVQWQHVAPTGLKLFFDSSFYAPGNFISNILFGPLSAVPKSFRVVSMGYGTTSSPHGYGVYDAAVDQQLIGGGSGYTITKISRATGMVTYVMSEQPLNSGTGANLATALNAIGSDYIVVVHTYDEPSTSRLVGSPSLATALYRCGASRGIFESSQFNYRCAYVLIGIPGSGEGNGFQAMQPYDGAGNAWVDTTFSLVNGNPVFSTGGGTLEINTIWLAPNAATVLSQDNHDFARTVAANGSNVQRTLNVTPAKDCTIQFNASMGAQNCCADSNSGVYWAVSVGGGADVILGSDGSTTSYIGGIWSCSNSFAASAGVSLAFKMYSVKAIGITGPTLLNSQMTVCEIRR